MKKPLSVKLIRKPILITVSCLAVTAFLAAGSPALAQDTGVLLQEVQAMLRQPLPAPPDDMTLPPAKSDEALTQQLRAMLFDNEAAGRVTQPATRATEPPAAALAGVGTAQSTPSSVAGPQVAAPNPLTSQIRVELPPAPPEKYAPTAAQSRPAPLPNPATIPLPPHPPESQAPSAQPRPPVSLPAPAAPLTPPARLPDPTIIPLPPHPPEEQAPWRQGV